MGCLIVLANVGYGHVVLGASVGICIRNAMVNMFAYNAAATTTLIKVPKSQLSVASYECRNKWKYISHDTNLLQPWLVGQVVKEKSKEKGKDIFQESQIIPSLSFQTD